MRIELMLTGPLTAESLESELDEVMNALGYERVERTEPASLLVTGAEESFDEVMRRLKTLSPGEPQRVQRVVARAFEDGYWVEVPRPASRRLAQRGKRAYEAEVESFADDTRSDGGSHRAVTRVYRIEAEQLVVDEEEELEGDGALRGGALSLAVEDLLLDLIAEREDVKPTSRDRTFAYALQSRFDSELLNRAWRACLLARSVSVDTKGDQVQLRLSLDGDARRILILKPDEWAELEPHVQI